MKTVIDIQIYLEEIQIYVKLDKPEYFVHVTKEDDR